MPLPEFVQERLIKLNEIDDKLVTTLDNASKIIESLVSLKDPSLDLAPQEATLEKEKFQTNVAGFYQNLNVSVTALINEIKLYKVPITLNSNKNTGQDDQKINSEWAALGKVIGERE